MHALRTPCLALLVAVTLAACTGPRPRPELPTQEVSGLYTAGADGQWFRPCEAGAAEEAWWVTFTGRAVTQRDSAPFADAFGGTQPVFVRWRAALGDRAAGAPEGPGPGSRYVLVREVIAARPATAADCPAGR